MQPHQNRRERLPSYALFAGVLACAGLPIYINAPKFYFDEYGISLATLGVVLFGLRLFDVFQDPALGWLSGRLAHRRGIAVAIAGLIMGGAMVALFAVTPPFNPLIWFAIALAFLFSSFSFLSITFYAQGVAKVANSPNLTHVRLASWREAGGLIGVCLAAIAPLALGHVTLTPFHFFAWLFFAASLVAVIAMRFEWTAQKPNSTFDFRAILADPGSRRLLIIAFANSAPVAITSTLFLFFTQYRLEAPGAEGPLLLLFFVAAAISTPFWGKAAARYGYKPVLLAGMALAIITFSFAAFLGAGDVGLFAVVCLFSGAALGADMTLLPAIFAAHIATGPSDAGQAFGLWAFVSKLTLAIAAITVLPILQWAGISSDVAPTANALTTLTFLYAVLPGALKLIAVALVLTAPSITTFQKHP